MFATGQLHLLSAHRFEQPNLPGYPPKALAWFRDMDVLVAA